MNSCCESEEIAEPESGLSREDETLSTTFVKTKTLSTIFVKTKTLSTTFVKTKTLLMLATLM